MLCFEGSANVHRLYDFLLNHRCNPEIRLRTETYIFCIINNLISLFCFIEGKVICSSCRTILWKCSPYIERVHCCIDTRRVLCSVLCCPFGDFYINLPDWNFICSFGVNARSLISSTAAMDVPVLYAPTAFDNASLSVPEVNLFFLVAAT